MSFYIIFNINNMLNQTSCCIFWHQLRHKRKLYLPISDVGRIFLIELLNSHFIINNISRRLIVLYNFWTFNWLIQNNNCEHVVVQLSEINAKMYGYNFYNIHGAYWIRLHSCCTVSSTIDFVRVCTKRRKYLVKDYLPWFFCKIFSLV